MTEKELRKKAVGNNVSSNILLSLKILFDLIPQVLLVKFIDCTRYNSGKGEVYFSCNVRFLYSKGGVLLLCDESCPRKSI